MSFFDGIDTNATDFESGVFTIIPKDTRVLATCEGAKNEMYNGDVYIKLTWRVNRPENYANAVIFQKLKVFDSAKAAQHKAMLAAIARNAGGRLFDLMRTNNESEPSDATLHAALVNSTMVLMLDVWELDGKSGNWVKAVSAMKGATPTPPPAPAPAHAPKPAPAADFDDSDIPF